MSLTIKTRWEIVFLHTHKKGPQLSYADIAKHLKIARSTVKTWVERFLDTGDVQDLEGRGRKRKTTQRDDIRIIRLAENDPRDNLKEDSFGYGRQGSGGVREHREDAPQ